MAGGSGTELREQTDEAVRWAESQISAILTIAADAIIFVDDSQHITVFNDGAEAIFGYSKSEMVGQPLERLIPVRFRTPHRKHVSEFASAAMRARKMGERQEIFALRKDGTEFPAEASIAKAQVGGRRVFMAVLRDVTDRKRVEDLLSRSNAELEARVQARTLELEAEIRRREEAQAALVQAQRMEAFGQLTGGIAHDFNNLLTIVMGNLELLDGHLGDAASRAFLKRAADAAQMGAALTSRLLTFARRRRLSPRVLNLNKVMLNIIELLKRSLGEPITLTTMLAGDLWPTRADESEVENAIVNLAINARDAMPRGGTLIIETRNVSLAGASSEADPGLARGDFVRIAVSDTGVGMSAEILKKAFEPFFTTKEPGRGTGLGLSTLYGFAQQSGGQVSISSEPDRGTTVYLYLPRSDEEVASRRGEEPAQIPLAQNSEIVLVVEDNPEVRELTLQRVEGLGYVALEAENATAAIRILESGEAVDLIFSDIVMAGGMSGYELASWVRAHAPKVKALLTTGYAAEEAKHNEGGAEAFRVLRKPYTRAELALALRDILRS